VDRYTLPSDDEFPPAMDAFFKTVTKPETAARATALIDKGFQKRSDVE